MYRGEKMSRIAYNQREVDLLARLIRAEAVGEGDEGMLLVGNVVVNPSLEVLTMKVWKFIR